MDENVQRASKLDTTALSDDNALAMRHLWIGALGRADVLSRRSSVAA